MIEDSLNALHRAQEVIMAPPDHRPRRRRFPFYLNPALLVFLAMATLTACSSNSCGCDGFKQQPFPSEHVDKTVPKTGQVRVTDAGLRYLEQQIPNIIGQFLPGGLNFCVPNSKQSGATICATGTCNNGQKGCQLQLSIDKASLKPNPPSTLDVEIRIGDLNEVLPVDLLGLECKLDLHKKNAGNDTPATVDAAVPIEFIVNQDQATNDVEIRVGDPTVDLNKLDFDIDGRGGFGNTLGCGSIDIGTELGFVRQILIDQIKGELKSVVKEATDEQLCRQCGGQDLAKCPSKSSCKDLNGETKVCRWKKGTKNEGKCVGRSLGIEGRLAYQAILGDFMESAKAEVDLMAKAADMATVDSGISLGLRSGFQQTRLSDCAPIAPGARPSFDPIANSPAILSNTKAGSNESFMIGIGLHKRALEHMFWSTWASGALCFKIGSDFNDLLNTSGISLLVPSIKDLADRKGPIFLRVTPQTAPKITLGDNKITKMGDSYTLEDPLLTLNWKDLDLHFYAFVQERHTRLFTIRTDLEVPIGLSSDGMGKIIPVMGDLEQAAENIRVRNHRILSDSKDKLKQIIPTLLGAALPQLAGSLSDPVELPEFFGYRLALEQDDIKGVDNGQFIALYADLVYVGTNMPLMATDAPVIAGLQVDSEAVTPQGVPRPKVALQLDTGLFSNADNGHQKREFSYRLDGGVWSMWTENSTLELDEPVLALQGEHEISVRARIAGMPGTASDPVTRSFLVDYAAPELAIRRDGGQIRLEGVDSVDEADQLRYRWRAISKDSDSPIAATPWSSWSPETTLDPDALTAQGDIKLEAQVRDRSGYITDAARDIDLERVRAAKVAEQQEKRADNPTPEATGCSTVGAGQNGSDNGAPGPLGLLSVLVSLGAFGWRRKTKGSETNRGRFRGGTQDNSPTTPRGRFRGGTQDNSPTTPRGRFRGGTQDNSPTTPRGRFRGGTSIWLLSLVLLTTLGLTGCSKDETGQEDNANQCDPACADWETCEEGGCFPKGCASNDECPDGATCLEGQCKESECQMDADCTCAEDKRGVCMNGQCLCKNFCPDGCGDGEFCCYQDNSCQSIPDPCADKSCEPGYEPKATSEGTPDKKSCEVAGASCECVEKPPLDLKWFGQYASISSNEAAGVTAVSAYNRYYGDLMVGVLDDQLKPTWYFAAGMPDSGEIVAAPSGPRGGISNKGDDLGTHTAIAVDDSGTLHVFYRSEENGDMMYARGTKSGSGDGPAYSFESTVVDSDRSTGKFTSAIVHDGVVYASYGLESIEVEVKVPGDGNMNGDAGNMNGDAGMGGNGMNTKKVDRSQLRHVSFPVDAALDSLSLEPTVLHQSPPANPCDSSCSGDGEVCFKAAKKCGTPTDDCDSACAAGSSCRNGKCVASYSPPSTPSHPAMTGLYSETLAAADGRIAVVFYDHVKKRVGWVWRDKMGEWGEASFVDEPSGPYASGAVDSTGTLHLAYMQATTKSLRYWKTDAKDKEFVVDGIRDSGGEYVDAIIGHDVTLSVDGNDVPHVTFHDATKHSLVAADRGQMGNWTLNVLAEPGPEGNYTGQHGFFADTDGNIAAEMVIDVQDEEKPGAHMQFWKVR